MAFVERKITFIEWTEDNVGREIVGFLESVEMVAYNSGPPGLVYTLISLMTPGEVFQFRGATRLNAQLHKRDIGKLISVMYNGEDRSKERSKDKQNYPKSFTVKVDEDSDD